MSREVGKSKLKVSCWPSVTRLSTFWSTFAIVPNLGGRTWKLPKLQVNVARGVGSRASSDANDSKQVLPQTSATIVLSKKLRLIGRVKEIFELFVVYG
jgi:hypothetical protein